VQFVYGGIWLLVGFILIFSLSKTNKVFYPLGGYFIFMGGWWIADAFLADVNLMAGVPGIVFRVITAVALVFAVVVFFKAQKESKKQEK
jgi:hypothetical protein